MSTTHTTTHEPIALYMIEEGPTPGVLGRILTDDQAAARELPVPMTATGHRVYVLTDLGHVQCHRPEALTAVAESVHRQGLGPVAAIPAGLLLPGDRIIYNYGYPSTVERVTRKTIATVEVTETTHAGNEHTSRKRTHTLVGADRQVEL